LVLGVLVLMLLSLLPTSAANVPKAGASCSKQGAVQTFKSLKYTCIKSGRKLVWSKGVKVVSRSKPSAAAAKPATPTPIETPAPVATQAPFIPWSTDATAKQVSDAAQKNFRAWAAEQTNKPLNHQFVIQEGVLPNRAKAMTLVDETAARLFSQFLPTKSVTVIGKSEAWVVEKLNSLGGNFTRCSITLTEGLDFCWDSITMQGLVVYSDSKFDPRSLAHDASSLLAHEQFHLVQFALSINGTGHIIKNGTVATSKQYPAWFIEGSAEFVSYSVSTLAMGADYWQGRDSVNILEPGNPVINRNALEDSEIRTFAGTQPNGPVNPYMIGRVATEYLVASIGFGKFLEIFKSYKETNDFEKSFALIAGISKSEFYEKFERIRTNLGMPEVSWKLVCTTNTPLRDVPAVLPKCDIKSTLPGGFSG
jgi:hypothetical protein